jgi:hypothetical protein
VTAYFEFQACSLFGYGIQKCPSVLHYYLYSGGSEFDFPSNVQPTGGVLRFASLHLSKCCFHVRSNMFEHPLDNVSHIKFKITGEPYWVNKLSKVNNSFDAYIPTIVSTGTAGYCVSPKRDCTVRESMHPKLS